MTVNRIAFKIKTAAERAVVNGHPWIYESSITKQSKEGRAGDVAIIFDKKKNNVLAVGLYDPKSEIRIKVLSVGSLKIDQNYFKKQFEKASLLRKDLLKTETNAYRWIYGENDGFPGLIVDVYVDIIVIKLYTTIWLPYLELIVDVIKGLLKPKAIVLRLNRKVETAEDRYKNGEALFGQISDSEVTFKEHGLEFTTDVIKGHKTGYFLDHRHNRLKVRHLSKNKKVLDVFSYAGGFSVNAAFGGATEVTSIDISSNALDAAKKNVAKIKSDVLHKVIQGDAFLIMKQQIELGIKYDLIIIDPPTMASKESQIEKALQSYKRLLRYGLKLMENNGILVMASCTSRIKAEEYFEMIEKELIELKIEYKIIEKTRHDIDHPERIVELSYLKTMYIQVKKSE